MKHGNEDNCRLIYEISSNELGIDVGEKTKNNANKSIVFSN